MRDIYLIDFENVASEGLNGITNLSPEDQVIIFYSTNSNRLSMKMHILIGKSTCKLSYFEVSVGGKNALDHQISTWLGYLIGVGAAERSYYIVSRDMGYRHVANFWAQNDGRPRVCCVETIRAAARLERIRREKEEAQRLSPEESTEGTEPEGTEKQTATAGTPLLNAAQPILQLKAADTATIQEQPKAVQPEPERDPVSVETALHQEREPAEALDTPEPSGKTEGGKNHQGRTKFRRNHSRGHQEYHVAEREKLQEHAAPEKADTPKDKAEIPAVQQGEKHGAEASAAPAPQPAEPEKTQPEKKEDQKTVPSERYSSSFWMRSPAEIQQAKKPEPVPQKSQELSGPEKQEKKVQEAEKAQPKPEAQPQKAESKDHEKAKQSQEKPHKPAAKQPEAKKPGEEKKQSGKPQNTDAKSEEKPQEVKNNGKPKQKKQENKQQAARPKKSPEHDFAALERMIAPYTQLKEEALKELVLANKRQVLCNTLRKELGQEKGLALYNELKKSVWK